MKLPCGCWGEQRPNDGLMVIEAEGFLCKQGHRQGQVLTPIDVANLAVARAFEDGLS